MNNVKILIPENFTVNEAAKFRESTYSTIASGKSFFELDFKKCEFIDSTGLGVLVGLLKKCKENDSDIELRNLNANVLKIFHMTRLDQVFTIK